MVFGLGYSSWKRQPKGLGVDAKGQLEEGEDPDLLPTEMFSVLETHRNALGKPHPLPPALAVNIEGWRCGPLTYLRKTQVDWGCLRDVHDLPIWGHHKDETIQSLQRQKPLNGEPSGPLGEIGGGGEWYRSTERWSRQRLENQENQWYMEEGV